MLRVAIPYGELSSNQMYKLADIADKYDKGYGHFTTRQNIQFNWPKLTDVPNILEELSEVEMHAIQTSGNCIRNISSDHFAGICDDEVQDPRPWCEIIRKWSTFHPEFSFLPRKFKIAVTGSNTDRAAIKFHDIGLKIVKYKNNVGFEVFVGGGQGRSPYVAKQINNFIKQKDLLNYLEAILSTYNELGRRDNIYKARIKILVHELGIEKFKELVEVNFLKFKDKRLSLDIEFINKTKDFFKLPNLKIKEKSVYFPEDIDFNNWLMRNVVKHKIKGYSVVLISLKENGKPPGDATSNQMRKIATISKEYSFSEIRVTHEQNLVLPHIENSKLSEVWGKLKESGLATPNLGFISDTICCPGMDYCALATARSIPISNKISKKYEDFNNQNDIGNLKIKISGCINACGHHHVGNIGILGLERNGQESYQLTLGGSADENASIGEILGPSFQEDKLMQAIEKILIVYKENRNNKNEDFLKVFKRIGITPFKEGVYDNT
jgi:sulfite reductase (NADPH) hemoprotein beta-component